MTLLQLTIDLGDNDTPAIRSDIAELLGRALTEAIRRGHSGDLHTVDPSFAEATDEETPEMARARGYGEGFRDGWAHCEKAQPGIHVAMPDPGPMLEVPPHVQEKMRAGQAEALANEPDYMAFPPTLPLPPSDAPRHLLTHRPPDYLSTDYDDYDPGVRPEGVRPVAGPGAPVSAYDQMPPATANQAYGFPQYPQDEAPWTDSEGAQWIYMGADRMWERQTFPREWGPSPSGSFPVIALGG